MRHDERVVRAGDPALPGRRRLVREARRMLWNLLRERIRELRLARSQIRRRLGDFLARSTAGRLLAILRSAALSGALAAALLAPGAAHAQDFPAIELAAIARGEGGFQARGEGKPGTRGSGLLAGAGDVNGDGIPDVIVAGSLCNYECSSAPTYVVFGKPDGAAVDLAEVEAGRGGFAIRGVTEADLAGSSVSGAGDVNGDGLDDVLVGAPGAGDGYVVFGKPDGAVVELAEVEAGQGGFVIRGASSVSGGGDVSGDGLADVISSAGVVFGKPDGAPVEMPDIQAGRGGFAIRGVTSSFGDARVAAAGDVNGDGLAEIIIGAQGASPGGRHLAGESYVVFGKPDGAPVEMPDIQAGRGGFAIRGAAAYGFSGASVAGAGDVNGDGLADVIAGAPGVDDSTGESYVVFGKPDGAAVEIPDIQVGRGGFAIRGARTPDGSGQRVAGAGDVNGDGLADVIIGRRSVESYVVFGKPGGAAVELSEVQGGQGGFTIHGNPASRHQGGSVAGAGDMNGDGLGDVLVGGTDPRRAGQGHVVFGKPDGTAVELSAVDTGQGGFAIRGIEEIDYSSLRVAGAGDVNGDGLADILVAAMRRAPDLSQSWVAGESRVVFGKLDGAAVELAEVQAGPVGFVIRAVAGGDVSGSGAGAGDVNGDGLADLVTGNSRASPGGRKEAGEAHVVFGKSDSAAVDLAAVQAGQGGFAIRGAAEGDQVTLGGGAGAGDVNGDGLADVVIGAVRASPGGKKEAGESYVVFGKPDGAAVDLASVQAGQGGFAIRGAAAGDFAGVISGAGDVNGDGLDDVVIGAPRASPGGRKEAGESYVVFGKPDGAAVELAAVQAGRGGFAMRGVEGVIDSGSSVAAASDVNGDGLADVLVGSPFASPLRRAFAGETFVVLGKSDSTAVELSAIQAGRGGFTIRGAAGEDFTGVSISGAGDLNGDGLADVLVGEARFSPESRFAGGDSYVVFGKSSGAPVDLRNVETGRGGFAIRGLEARGRLGPSVAGAGDVDGDGLADDLVIASGLPGVRYASISGAAYVVFGPRDGGAGTRFRRGAVRGEEEINISDAIGLLGHLFLGGEAPPCLDAADADDSGALDLTDAIHILRHLFQGGEAPPDPGPASCGRDPTEDELDCASSPPSCGN